MYIAQAKRRENIAEYILYLWQIADVLRALQFSPEAIYSQLVKPRGLEPDKENELLLWYMDIAGLLQQEDKAEQGYLDHTLHLIGDLKRLHEQLLVLPAGEHYKSLFDRLLPELPHLRQLLGREDVGDIELAFRALYAVMLYRIKGDEKKEKSISDVIELVSPVIAELAQIYRQAESGEKDIFAQKKE